MIVAITHGVHSPERCGSLRALLDQVHAIERQGVLPFRTSVVVDAGLDGCRPAAFRTLGAGLRKSLPGERIVLLQEDMVLAPDFVARFGRVLCELGAEIPEVLFLFSTLPEPRTISVATERIHLGARPVAGGACTLLSREAARWALERQDYYLRRATACTERVLLDAGCGSDATVYPSLAQHRWQIPSSHKHAPARSPSYDAHYGPELAEAPPVAECPWQGVGWAA